MKVFWHKGLRGHVAVLLLATLCMSVAGCDKKFKKSEPVEVSKKSIPASAPSPVSSPNPAAEIAVQPSPTPSPTVSVQPAPAAVPPPPDICRKITKLEGAEAPVAFTELGFVLTRFMKPCVNREGERGVEENSPWLAMGFPCTGASGRIEIKGTYNSPKMISFVLGTDCGMNPDSAASVERMVREKLDLPENSRLLAFTPFVVQYWEVPGFTDADIGFAIELRSTTAIEGNWRRFTGNQPLHVKLYGRENTWVQGGFFYAAEGDLRITGRNTFQMKLTSVKKLSQEEIDEVKGRCDELKPKRNCSDVFP